MDGFEVAEAITSLNKTRDTPIIFLSAVNTHKRFVTKGFESGAVDYITKPVDPDILILKVRNFYRLYEKTMALKQAERELKALNEGLERRVAERTRELLEINRELEITNHDLQQFASVASHDLKEPLRKIQLFGNMIREAGALEGKPATHLEKIIRSAERMSNLIQDLLSVTRLSEKEPFRACRPRGAGAGSALRPRADHPRERRFLRDRAPARTGGDPRPDAPAFPEHRRQCPQVREAQASRHT
jgi:signal transduction histidine kinase